MGGCAGKFKGSDDLPPEPHPSDAPVNPDQADQGETVAKEKEVGETKTEAPLVDVSEEKKEGDQKPAEPASPAAPAAAAVAAAEPEKKEETPVAKSEAKVEALAAPEKKEETPVAKETEKKESEVAPAKEANKETPLVKASSEIK